MPLGGGKPTCTAGGQRRERADRRSRSPARAAAGAGDGQSALRADSADRSRPAAFADRRVVRPGLYVAGGGGLDGPGRLRALSGRQRLGAHRVVGRRGPRPRELAPAGRGLGLAQGLARDGARPGVQTLWRRRRLGRNHVPVPHAAGLCRCHVVVAFSIEMAADCDRCRRHVRRAFRGLSGDHRLGRFVARRRADDGLERRLDRRREHARIQRQPAGAIRRLLHPLRPARAAESLLLRATMDGRLRANARAGPRDGNPSLAAVEGLDRTPLRRRRLGMEGPVLPHACTHARGNARSRGHAPRGPASWLRVGSPARASGLAVCVGWLPGSR